MSDREISKYIALILRHKPETIGIVLDEHGWADVSSLIDGINKTYPIDLETLKRIVAEDNKKRYSFNEDMSLIRANQGHSIPVDVELEKKEPPAVLYHGTGIKYANAIDAQGLLPKSRLYVHLSEDIHTAILVGRRHGDPILYKVDSGRMWNDGFAFYRSVNGVWLTEQVPIAYLNSMKEIEQLVEHQQPLTIS
ncbi:MAG: RNA 2'-phosphotransferase [Lachnospiraceae bacterium]|nr:RNA 2'-phosphotransferase [Lachnospiraceae bacterium]